MKLEKAAPRQKKNTDALSFRLAKDASDALTVLSKVLNKSKTQVIEDLLAIGLQDALKRFPKEVKEARKGI